MPPPPNANPMLSLRIQGLSGSGPSSPGGAAGAAAGPAKPAAAVAVVSSNHSATSSERAWEEEYQQWKKFQKEAPSSSKRGGGGGGRPAPRGQQVEAVRASSSFSSFSPPSSSNSKASKAFDNNKKPSSSSKRPGGIPTSYSMTTAVRPSAKRASAVYHRQRRAVSPCIESTAVSFEDDADDRRPGDRERGSPAARGRSPLPAPALAEIAEDEDRDEDQREAGRGRRPSPSSFARNHRRSNSGSSGAVAAVVSSTPAVEDDDGGGEEEEFDDDSPIPEHFVKHIKAAFGPAAAGPGARQRGGSRQLARPPASSSAGRAAIVDLYRDVLRVDRLATDRELRTAFFKRGRQVLGSQFPGGIRGGGDDERSTDSAAEAKQQFQAISMAYEILTTPELRSYYDRRGLVSSRPSGAASPPRARAAGPGTRAAPSDPSPPPSPTFEALKQKLSKDKSERAAPSPPSLPSPSRSGSVSPALRARDGPRRGGNTEPGSPKKGKKKSRSLSRGRRGARQGRSRSASRSIRWNEHVEQLVFERSPDELRGMRNGGGKGEPDTTDAALVESALSVMMGDPPAAAQQPPRKLRKVKRRVVLEAQELARELEAMHDGPGGGGGAKDRQNFIGYFLDDLEASLDGLEASVDNFWRFATSSAGSADGPDGAPRGSKSKAESVRNGDGSPRKDDNAEGSDIDEDDSEEDGAIDAAGRVHDDTSIGTDEFMQAAFRVPEESAAPPSPREPATRTCAASFRVDLQTTPSLDEEAEQELRSSKILGAFERNSDAGSQSSSTTSGRARAAQDPALNSERLSVRERVAVLAAAGSAAAPNQASSQQSKQGRSQAGPTNPKPAPRLSRFRRFGLKSKSMADSSDAADLLYDDLMKPLPTKSTAAARTPSSRRVDGSLNDVTRKLFQDLTKPPPSGYDDSSAIFFPRLASKKANAKPRSRSCGPSYSRSLLDDRDQTVLDAFDPFRLDDVEFGPPQRIYDVASSSRELASLDGTATLNTLSTMSGSEATTVLRDRILAKHRAAAVTGKQRTADTRRAHEMKSSQVASPVAVDAVSGQGFDEGLDALSRSFESQDPGVLRLDRTKGSAMSSLTGHASHFTVQQEHAWRHLCNTTSERVTRECSFEKGDPTMRSACTASPVTSTDQDLESRIMEYMQAFTEGVDRVGLSLSNMMSAAVAVPEENVQGVLNVLSKEMDSSAK